MSKKHVREHVQATKEANLYSTHAMECPRSSKRESLLENFISIEEYQMNMEVMYSENPTSLAYSANKLTVAMYPICIKFKAGYGTIAKGAITFLKIRNIPINRFNNLNTGCLKLFVKNFTVH